LKFPDVSPETAFASRPWPTARKSSSRSLKALLLLFVIFTVGYKFHAVPLGALLSLT
ncbi:hypothetical protein L9F63_023885, partial [Diploptera punctata]